MSQEEGMVHGDKKKQEELLHKSGNDKMTTPSHCIFSPDSVKHSYCRNQPGNHSEQRLA